MDAIKDLLKDYAEKKVIDFNFTELYTWSSGIKSPIYCDHRKILAYPNLRSKVIKLLVNKIQNDKISFDAIAGVATAGIPWGAILAHELNVPFIYVRTQSKEHGKKKLIEGDIAGLNSFIVFEDLISTGGSALKVVATLKEEGKSISQVMSIFTYNQEKTAAVFKNAQTNVSFLVPFNHLISSLPFSSSEKEKLTNFVESF